MVLLATLTTYNKEYTLNDSLVNYSWILSVAYYGTFALASTLLPRSFFVADNSVIVCMNDGTLRKGQYSVVNNTKVKTSTNTTTFQNITSLVIYGIK